MPAEHEPAPDQVIHSISDAEETDKQAARLIADAPDRMAAYALEMDIVDRLNRVFYHARRIAKHAQASSD